MAFQRFTTFAPDEDPTTPGIVIDGSSLVPSIRGFEAAPSATDTDTTAVSATVLSAVTLTKINGNVRTFVGTRTTLEELSAGTWVDRSNGTYGATRWRFAQYGDQSIAANKADTIQQSASGAFADLTGAPKASIVEVLNRQVVAFDISNAAFGDSEDRWITSAIDDSGDWTPSIATQAASGRLVDTPGKIIAGKRFSESALTVHKKGSMYLGRYVGGATVWDFDLLSDEIGAVSQEAIVAAKGFQMFVGQEDFYIFDGAQVVPVGNQVRQFFFNEQVNNDFLENIVGVHDRANSRIYWYYPVSTSDTGRLEKYIPYNYKSDRWGVPCACPVRTVFQYRANKAPTYDTLGNLYATYNDLPTIPYNDASWVATSDQIGLFDTSDNLKTLDGTAATSSLVSFDFGDDQQFSFVSRIRPRFKTTPTSADLIHSYRDNLGDTLVSSTPAISLNNGKYDTQREARWHRFRQNFTGDMEIMGIDIQADRGGLE